MIDLFRCRLIDGVANSSGQSQSTVGWLRMLSTRVEPLLNRCTLSSSAFSSKKFLISHEKAGQLVSLAWPYVVLMYRKMKRTLCSGVNSRNMTCKTSERLHSVTVAARRQSGGNEEDEG